jgi:CHAT domain-containing protein/Tfp pilus assembly protein PilF
MKSSVFLCGLLIFVGVGRQAPDPALAYTQALRLYGAKQPEAALELFKQVIRESPRFDRAYRRLVAIYQEQKNPAGAVGFFQSWAEREPENSYAAYGLGLTAREAQQLDRALEQFKLSLRRDPDFAPAYTALCDTATQTKRAADAVAFIEQILAARPNTAAALYGLGYLAVRQSQWERALTLLAQARDRDPQLWEAQANIAFSLRRTSRYREAQELYERLLSWAERTGDDERRARTLGLLGELAGLLGSYPSSLDQFQQAAEFAREFGDRQAEESYLGNIGAVYFSMGQYVQASIYYQRALTLAQAIGARSDEGRLLGTLAKVHEELGNLTEAATLFEQAVALARETGDRGSESSNLADLGAVYAQLGDCRRALPLFERTLAIVRDIGPKAAEAEHLEDIGYCQQQLGNYREALAAYEQALAIARATSFLRAEASCLNHLGRLHLSMKDEARAVDSHQRALQLGARIGSPKILWEANAGLAAAYERQGRFAESLDHYRQAIEVIEKVRGELDAAESKAGFLQSKITVYKNLVGLFMNEQAREPTKNHEAMALETSERARARSLLDMLAEANVAPERMSAAPLGVEAVQSLLDERTALLEYSLAESGSFLFVVSRDGVRSFRLAPESEIVRLVTELRTALERFDQMREFRRYAQAAERLYQILIAPAADALATKRALLIVPDGALYYLPFECLLTKATKAGASLQYGTLPYLLKDWAVSYVPSAGVLANLRERRRTDADARSKAFLAFADPVYEIETKISNSKSQTSNRGRRTTNDAREVVRSLFGEEVRRGLPRLVASGREVSGIAKLFKSQETVLYLRQAATEEAVKRNEHLGRARRIHFATHGLISEPQPRYSGLVLTLDDDPAEDGLLQVFEIFNLKLNADLVVLSACRTGLGKEVKGEGLIGLARAFMYAGAQSLVVSLWRVADRPTADLMVKFYRRLDRDGNKTEALRQAKLQMIQVGGRFAHPLFWAPFVLIGEPR